MYSKSNVYIYADVIRNNIENVCRDYIVPIGLYRRYAICIRVVVFYLSRFIII